MEATQSLSDLFPTTTAGSAAASNPSELGQEDFLELMVAQMENQDPTKPMDNFEFLSQIAQFGTVDGIQSIEQSISQLSAAMYASQTLQAAGLVGSKVMTDSNLGTLAAGETLSASVDVPAANTGLTLYIQDMSGQLVHTRQLGVQASGELKVEWDGLDDSGDPVLPGQYRISAETEIDGEAQAVPVYAHTVVDSVTVDRSGGGVTLNLAGGDQVGISQVRSFL
ncbi:MAG: flagellar biosynthesis protein FlgD [Halioglobus sp.]|nr:flagellar biosynthesis protein FlgD [Halioglobus sp.]